ncbi:Protein transport protein SEC16B homolog [Linum perenne]
MDSNPPFQETEDQIDDDFFDNLVEDDIGPASSSGAAQEKFASEGSDPDEAKEFDNLSMEDANGVEDVGGVEEVGDGANFSADVHVEESDAALNNAVDLSNDGTKSEAVPDQNLNTDVGSTKSGVKEVDWSSLFADSSPNGDRHGSYSDFFSELGGDTDGSPVKVDSRTANVENSTAGEMQNSNYGQHQEGTQAHEGYSQENASVQDVNSTQYWESMYPGWKYDMNTGQWYQVDGYNAAGGVQESYNANVGSEWATASDGKGTTNFLQQSSQSMAGTMAGTSTTESVSSWNQVSQDSNNGYPAHMIFDPQYPGWYYDTIAQEWRSLESYTASAQSVIPQTQETQSQNGYGFNTNYSQNVGNVYGQSENYDSHAYHSQGQDISGSGSNRGYNQRDMNMWSNQSASSNNFSSDFGQKQNLQSPYGSNASTGHHLDNQQSFNNLRAANGFMGSHNFVQGGNFNQQLNQGNSNQMGQMNYSNDYYSSQKPISFAEQSYQSNQQLSHAPGSGRSSAGRPPHALVSFGFGGKLVVVKENAFGNSSFETQATGGGSISVMNLMEVVSGSSTGNFSAGGGTSCNYFHPLCQQSFPGPLVGGNAGTKDLNKWIEERITNCESPNMDYRKREALKLLLSLLKIACQHYGKLRSPFGSDTSSRENDTPESAVAKLFSSAKRQLSEYGSLSHCLQNMPSEAQLRATASEVQNLLVAGRKTEALQYAQEGQLWGPALVLASQLGDQFYVDTVKKMALRQLLPGSPLRTLCLLIAGQPAEVFSSNTRTDGFFSGAVGTQQPLLPGANSMLDDWEQNLALITANRTKDDELVIIHLGDCLWKDRSEITAAHICYLVAEANFETYSDTARLCLIGADHWKHPRTFANPEAIQRTELYEYSKVLGNSQFILQPFQPYKLVYAYMLAEIGRVSDSLKYCQAVLKSLKTGRAPEIETWKQLGGFGTNLQPAKFVGKLLNFFDSTAHRVVGGLPPPSPSISHGLHSNDHDQQMMAPRVAASQSTMAMSTLVPSASMEPISEWAADGNKMGRHSRSVSEPDFGRTPRQVSNYLEFVESSTPSQEKPSNPTGGSRLGRFSFGSQLLQKTVGLMLRSRSDKQAKLGEKNKFYYDEKLKRWVEEGVDPPAEETALPPPPTTATFPNGASDYNLKSALKNDGSPPSGSPKLRNSAAQEHGSGIPPIPTNSNQFSARGRMGVRSRYVDTFNQGASRGGGAAANVFHSPPTPVAPKPAMNTKFFVPAPAPDSPSDFVAADNTMENDASSEILSEDGSFHPAMSSPPMMQRFPSMNNLPGARGIINDGTQPHSRRTASWSGSFDNSLSSLKGTEMAKSSLGLPGIPPANNHMQTNSGGSFGDLQEVQL